MEHRGNLHAIFGTLIVGLAWLLLCGSRHMQDVPLCARLRGSHFDRDQDRQCKQHAGNSPQPSAKPNRDEHDDGIEVQPSAEEYRLNDLPLYRGEAKISAGHQQSMREGIEGHQRDNAQDNQSRSRPEVGNEVQHGRKRAP